MSRRVVRHRVDRGAELRDCAVEIAGVEQALAGVGGEERGLLGSAYYCKNPVFSLKDTMFCATASACS